MRKIAALLFKDMRLYGRKMLSTLLLAALLLCGTVLALGALLSDTLAAPEPLRLALVDNDRSALSDAAVNAVANSEDIAALFTVEYCDEAAAKDGIGSGEYAAAILFAKNFFSKILAGDKDAITICLSERFSSAADIVSHFAKTGETLIRVAEYGVMSTWPPLRESLPYSAANDALTRLEMRYAMRLLSLPQSAFTVEVLPQNESGVGLVESYVLAYLVFFLLLAEILFYPFTVRDFAPPMLRRITSYGVRPFALLIEKTVLPFLLRMILTGVLLTFVARRFTLTWFTLCALLLCSLLMTALSILCSQSRIGLSLLFAFSGFGLLLGGGLLPRAMLPYAMTRVGDMLPAGLCANLLSPSLGGNASSYALPLLALWTAAAVLAACLYARLLCHKGGDCA